MHVLVILRLGCSAIAASATATAFDWKGKSVDVDFVCNVLLQAA